MKKRQLELKLVLDSYNNQLADNVIAEITRINFEAMQEIDKRKLANVKPLKENQRPVDYFLESLFFLVFERLHRGDRFRAFQILEQMRLMVHNL